MIEFRAMRVDQLKKFLLDRGIPSAGKKKDELVELAERAQGKYGEITAKLMANLWRLIETLRTSAW